MHFLIQTIDGAVVHDFCFEILLGRAYFQWAGERLETTLHEGLDFDGLEDPEALVPVGSVDFVSAFLRRFYPDAAGALRPLNVPEVLFPYAGRKIVNVFSPMDLQPAARPLFHDGEQIYKKSLETIKDPRNGATAFGSTLFDGDGRPENLAGFQVSELIDIVSEWRAFVLQGGIRYVANYSGNPLVFPSANVIRNMVGSYEHAPVAYTLDVAVTKDGDTVVVECHRFFSCGLYGYNDHFRIPKMLSQAWFEIVHPKKY